MSVLATTNLTLLDLAKRQDPDGSIADIVEILNQRLEILDDMSWIEGNLETGHRTVVRTGLPTPTWRKLYGGVLPTKSTTAQVTESCGMLEAYSEVDVALANLGGNAQAVRLSEDLAFMEGFNQQVAQSLIFGNEGTAPETFTGLAPRYNDPSALNGENIINGGAANGQTDVGSIWLVVWGDQTVHGIIPKNSKAGLSVRDLGEVTVENAPGGPTGGRYQAYRTHMRWDVGLSVKDWRYVVRIANIDKSLLVKNAASGADLVDLMIQAIEMIPNLNMGRPVFYVSRNIRSFLRRQISNKTLNSTLSLETVAGRSVVAFDGIPVRRLDTLAADETLLTFA
jgi:hypothetical protein